MTGTKSNNLPYKLISLSGFLFRIVVLPIVISRAYRTVIESIIGEINCPRWAYEILLRIVLFGINVLLSARFFHKISFWTVGNFYTRGKKPEAGSFYYNFFYVLYQVMLVFLFGPFKYWGVVCSFVIYSILCINLYGISSNMRPKENRMTPITQDLGILPKNWILKAVLHATLTLLSFVGIFLIRWFLF